MIPIRDVIPSRTTPWVTIGLLAVNAAVFATVFLPDAASRRSSRHGLVPAHFSWTAVGRRCSCTAAGSIVRAT